MDKNLNIKAIEEMLKKAVQGGELKFELSDDDIEFLLAHCEVVQPSKDLVPELEQIILNAIREKVKGKKHERARRPHSKKSAGGGAT